MSKEVCKAQRAINSHGEPKRVIERCKRSKAIRKANGATAHGRGYHTSGGDDANDTKCVAHEELAVRGHANVFGVDKRRACACAIHVGAGAAASPRCHCARGVNPANDKIGAVRHINGPHGIYCYALRHVKARGAAQAIGSASSALACHGGHCTQGADPAHAVVMSFSHNDIARGIQTHRVRTTKSGKGARAISPGADPTPCKCGYQPCGGHAPDAVRVKVCSIEYASQEVIHQTCGPIEGGSRPQSIHPRTGATARQSTDKARGGDLTHQAAALIPNVSVACGI